MQLKPFRSYEESDVINLYALQESDVDAGHLVMFGTWDPDNSDGYGANLSPFGGMSIPRKVSNARVSLATSGSTNLVVGATLWAVKEQDALGRPLIYTPDRYNSLQVVTSGQNCPILKRGILVCAGFDGVPAPGSGIAVSDSTPGGWKVIGADETPSLGKWLSSPGADGFAVAFLNVA
jgi:hypothetical protein